MHVTLRCIFRNVSLACEPWRQDFKMSPIIQVSKEFAMYHFFLSLMNVAAAKKPHSLWQAKLGLWAKCVCFTATLHRTWERCNPAHLPSAGKLLKCSYYAMVLDTDWIGSAAPHQKRGVPIQGLSEVCTIMHWNHLSSAIVWASLTYGKSRICQKWATLQLACSASHLMAGCTHCLQSSPTHNQL